MRAMIWGLILLGLIFVDLPSLERIGLARLGLSITETEFALYRTFGLIAVSILVFLEGVIALATRSRHAETTDKVEVKEAKVEQPAHQLDLEAAQDEVATLQKQNQDLIETVQANEARIAKLEKDKASVVTGKGDLEVINFVSLLQSKGRFIDFVMDDISKYPDAQIGAAARVVHQGCSQVVRDYFEIKPVASDAEGATLTLDKDYDTHQFKLLGNVRGEPPFKGRVLHRGWRTERIRLPEATARTGAGPQVIAPAEVELH